MFAGKKSAQIREILISESAWEEMTCLFAPSLIPGPPQPRPPVPSNKVCIPKIIRVIASVARSMKGLTITTLRCGYSAPLEKSREATCTHSYLPVITGLFSHD
ncbi:hypothetical protein FY858_11675 [Escherichia coli]|nr:hypothetical protein [Escherichia coli]